MAMWGCGRTDGGRRQTNADEGNERRGNFAEGKRPATREGEHLSWGGEVRAGSLWLCGDSGVLPRASSGREFSLVRSGTTFVFPRQVGSLSQVASERRRGNCHLFGFCFVRSFCLEEFDEP